MPLRITASMPSSAGRPPARGLNGPGIRRDYIASDPYEFFDFLKFCSEPSRNEKKMSAA